MGVDATKQIEKFKDFIDTNYLKRLHELVRKGRKALVIDFKELAKFDLELSEELLEEPEETLKAVEVAIDQFDLGNFRVRFFNLSDSQKIKIKDIRSEQLGKFLSVDGIVRQASDVRPQVVNARFECPSCGNAISVMQVESKFKEPARCSCGRRGQFRMLSKDLIDVQKLVVEEAPETLEGGEQPKRLDILLKEDLVEPFMEKKTTPGSKIRITGVIREIPIVLRTGGMSTRYSLMLDSNFIEPLEETFEEIELDKEDEERVKELAKDPKIYDKLKNSIAPSVYGHDNIKEVLVLQMVGGLRKERKDGTTVRGDMHILLVGDPGAAKSTFLTYMMGAAPKARYVAGRGATAAGITASVVKDEFLRGWALEAGALVLANGGLCAIDEMDKMSIEDTSALHEAMAQQTITIHKANIQATLRTQTAILAAANPKLGRFDPYEPIASQINLPSTLINRFDLIFPVRDLPDKKKDELIAAHILETHRSEGGPDPEIELNLLKKYVSYVKNKVYPKLSAGSVDEIKKFYVGLRNQGSTGEAAIKPIPINARQLEALIRLAEASARIRLSNNVTRSDARRAIRILRSCLEAVGIDSETGQIDIDMITTGVPAKQRNKIVIVRELISKMDSEGKKSIPIDEIMSDALDKGVAQDKVEEILEKFKREGYIFEPRRGFISKI